MPGYAVSSYIELFHKSTSFKNEIKTLSSFILLAIFLFNMKCQFIDINFEKIPYLCLFYSSDFKYPQLKKKDNNFKKHKQKLVIIMFDLNHSFPRVKF